MRLIVYAVSLIAFIAWSVGFFYYREGGVFHIFLVISFVSLVLNLMGGERLFRPYDD